MVFILHMRESTLYDNIIFSVKYSFNRERYSGIEVNHILSHMIRIKMVV